MGERDRDLDRARWRGARGEASLVVPPLPAPRRGLAAGDPVAVGDGDGGGDAAAGDGAHPRERNSADPPASDKRRGDGCLAGRGSWDDFWKRERIWLEKSTLRTIAFFPNVTATLA